MSVTLQDLSYDMLPKKIQITLNYFFVKKKFINQIHTCVWLPKLSFFFSCKLCFWSENLFQNKTSGMKGESEKINKMGGKGKRKKGGRRNYLDGAIMKDLSRPS